MFSRPSPYATPLPYAQVAVLMGVRLAEPIAYTIIFPFINQMIDELGVTDNPDRIGFYSGLVESAFAFVQVFTVYHWAKLSEGRDFKQFVVGWVGCATLRQQLADARSGLATNFWTMLFFRCLSGALNGNVAVIKASLGEITDETNSTDAFALYALTWTVGSILGTALGGALAHPVQRWPGLFGSWDVFRRHPYWLPCLVSAGCTLVGIIFAAAVYRESLPSKQHQHTSTRTIFSYRQHAILPGDGRQGSRHAPSRSDASDATAVSHDESVPMSPVSTKTRLDEEAGGVDEPLLGGAAHHHRTWGFWELCAHRPVRISNLALFLNSFVSGSWGAASLLFFYDRKNGLAMSTSAIGGALAVNGLWTIAAQLLILTRLRLALGLNRAYVLLTAGWIPVWLLLPLLRRVLEASETPNSEGKYADTRGWVVTIAVNALLSLVTLVTLNNSLLMVVVNNSTPDRAALGAVNGISTAVGSLARVVGPSLVSVLFAVSMDRGALGGRLWWVFMLAMSALNLGAGLLVPNEAATLRNEYDEDEYGDEDEDEDEDGSESLDGVMVAPGTPARRGTHPIPG
ncbi:Major facilitator-type transporter psiT2 [Vanrija pseudolonga]|uniref:Major facilitator-type transporter psiT2 n=1 Tax=Vanrija pseudolonga TaxID=143232 RepID=A0AAF0YD05_9TREE|nr:Major facilitator-type transporter psiT2 [Vanrija pseudolonga]